MKFTLEFVERRNNQEIQSQIARKITPIWKRLFENELFEMMTGNNPFDTTFDGINHLANHLFWRSKWLVAQCFYDQFKEIRIFSFAQILNIRMFCRTIFCMIIPFFSPFRCVWRASYFRQFFGNSISLVFVTLDQLHIFLPN